MKKLLFITVIIFLTVFPTKAQLTILSYLESSQDDGHYLHNDLILVDHYLYTLAARGGSDNYGALIRYDLKNDKLETVFSFTSQTGHYPYASVVYDGTYLYGMTYQGGNLDIGTAFKFNLMDSTFHQLFEFTGQNGSAPGAYPYSNFTISGQYLYGVAITGGEHNSGNIFKFNTSSNTFEDLYDLDRNNGDGYEPIGDLFFDGTYLYGVTDKGGAADSGVIFRFNVNDSTYQVIHNFRKATGAKSYCDLISDGTYLYGVTMKGGTDDWGVIFRIKPDGSEYTVLHNFTYTQGGGPMAGMTMIGNTLYGTMTAGGANFNGGIFKYDLNTNTFTVLYYFDEIIDSESKLLFYNNYLYGTSIDGGPHDFGTIYRYQLLYPEIAVSQGQNVVPDSATVDFGIVNTNTNKDLVFTITNTSNDAVLNIWGNPNITLKQGTAFSVVSYPDNVIDQGSSSNFTIRFSPTDTQSYADTLIIRNDDQDENPYVIIIKGSGAQSTVVNDLDNEIAIFPNPCTDHIFVHSSLPIQTIELYDLSGKLITNLTSPKAHAKINVAKLPPATYILKIYTTQGTITRQIIKH